MATLTQEWICFILFRFVMPTFFLAATIFRFNLFSLIYGLLLLVNALLYRPTFYSITRGMTGKYLMVTMIVTSITLLMQSVFQIYAAVTLKQQLEDQSASLMTLKELLEGQSTVQISSSYREKSNITENVTKETLKNILAVNGTHNNAGVNCSLLESVISQVGLQRIQHNDVLNVMRILCPDVVVFLVTLACLWCCQAWLSKPSVFRPVNSRAVDEQICKCANVVSLYLGNTTVVLLIATAGILRPSLINLTYFLVFILSMTMWSLVVNTNNQLMWFQRIRYFMASYAALHLLTMYVRQFPAVNSMWASHVVETSLFDRLLGLQRFTKLSNGCSQPQFLELRRGLPVLSYVHVAVVVLLYFVLAAEIRRWMLKMKFFTIRNVVNVKSIHQNILLKSGDLDEQSIQGNDTSLRPPSRQSNRESIGSVGFDSIMPFHHVVDPNRNHPIHSYSSVSVVKDYALKQSYIGTLIVMMVWSITYHSWLTFVLLLSACIIWIMPMKRALCLKFSPIILFYAIGLLMLQYIYGLDLTDQELPSALSNGFELRDIGLVKYENPAGPLAIKIMFTCVFWLTLRHSQERRCGLQQQESDYLMDTFIANKRPLSLGAHLNSRESEMVRNIGYWIWHTMFKYWIFACAGLFLFISLQEAVVFRLIYMTMFLYFVITFQVSYKFWRMSIQVFWWVVILYSMGVLTCIYTFQFVGFPVYWKSITGMSDQMLKNLGLKTIDTTELFIDLLTPTSFLIVVSIQLHYFQKDFLKMSDLNRFKSMGTVGQPERRDTAESSVFAGRRGKKDRFLVLCSFVWNKFYTFLNLTSAILWRFVEVHIFKVTATTIFICCITEVSALNTLLVLVVVILLPFPRLHSAMLTLEMILSSAILLFKMIYQMDIIVDDLMSSNCSSTESHANNSNVILKKLNNTDFIGIHKVVNMAKYLMIYIIMILMLSLESIVRYHQTQHYRHPKHEKPMDGIVFINVKRVHADFGLTQCFKFFINYSFYKFGKEMCFIVTMTTMVVRLDMYSVVYGVFLGILLLLNRRQCAFVWPFYIVILVVLLIAQYLSCVGAPPALCWVYPWSNCSYIHRNLQIFLYLPDYENPPWPHKLICDFFQLLFACLQWNVFHIEANKLQDYGGDDNRSIYGRLMNKDKNPQRDFLSYKDSYLDYIKMVVFFYSFWVTLMVVFISGMSRISLFCMGYLIGCFVFLWFGEGMLLKPLKKLTHMWMGLLMYCYLVLMAKCVLQLIGCVYLSALVDSHCWVVQLFNIVCLRSTNYVADGVGVESVCKMSVDEAGLSWDALCFVFLLFMLRIFKTWYFQHVVNELKINSKLAARGAELINKKLKDDINVVIEKEERVLQNIKLKMDRIRTKHSACMQERFVSTEQFADHYTVIRSGDYYMFKDVDDEDLELIDGDTISEEEESNNKESDDWRRKRTTVAPSTLLATAFFGGGPKEALSLIEKTSNFSRSMSMSSAREYTTPDADMQSPCSLLDGTTSTLIGSEQEDTKTVTAEDCLPSASTPFLSTQTTLSVPSPHSQIIIPEAYLHPQAAVPCTITHQKMPRHSDIMPCLPEVTLEMENDTSPIVTDTKDVTEQIEGEEGEEDDVDKTTKKVETGLRMLKVVLISFIDTLIIRINNSTRHYRTVSLKLHEEKELEKIKSRNIDIIHAQNMDLWQDRESPKEDVKTKILEHRCESEDNEEDQKDGSNNQKEDEINSRKRKENEFHNTMPRLIILVIAVSEALVARTDLLCYFAMIFNTIMSASILSIIYPLSVFFWGMLSVPRPTKFYWVAVITYTEFIIVLKYLFQFNFFPWNSSKGLPSKFPWPVIIGIEKKEMYAALDFFVLFSLFIHRMMLKKRGLWTQGQQDETKETKYTNNIEVITKDPVDGNAISFTAGDCPSVVGGEERRVTLCQKLFNPIKFFYVHITNPKYSAVNDVFAYMFACDLFTFLIVVFGYNKFGPSEQLEDSDVATVIRQSRVPVPFLAMLLVQFILIIIDRALYLRKLIFGKFIFHIVLVIVVHVWMFFLLPMVITDIPFVQNRAAQLWYFTKCIYFSFSCYQVRSGYPIRIVGNFLTNKFGYFNLFCFKGFLAIPFLLELRALTDWMWTDTTLALTSWLQMEDIYANAFVLKCWRKIEHDSPTPRAVPRHPVVKYGLGGLVLFLLIFIIWFPLLLFSMSNSIYEANPPLSVNFKLSISGYNTSSQPIFSVVSQRNQLHQIKNEEYLDLKSFYVEKPRAMAFLNAHREEDVYKVMVGGTSSTTWEISYPTEQRLIRELNDMHNMSFTVEISITREPPTNGVTVSIVSVHFVRHLNSSEKSTLAKMINGSYNDSVEIPQMFPRYLTVPSMRKINETGVLDLEWRPIILSLHQKRDDRSRWWELKESCPSSPKTSLDKLVCDTSHGSMVVTFSERIPKGVLTLVNNYGVIGLYVSVILVIGRFVRMQSAGNIQSIMFTNLPYVERLYGLCMDIYLVRQAGEFAFEELLFAKLNFLYRSTETMIAWTRHPKPKSE